jgi:hypothetical protein
LAPKPVKAIFSLPIITGNTDNNVDSNLIVEDKTININDHNISNPNNRNKARTTIPRFAPTAHWVLLTPNNTPGNNPNNASEFHAPNVSDGNMIPKYDYNEQFMREDFME